MAAYQCTRCKLVKHESNFYKDDERRYAWCLSCMEEEGRTVDKPPLKDRGGGVISVNYHSLKSDYNEDWWRL